MVLELETSEIFDDGLTSAAVYTDAAGEETAITAIVVPKNYGVNESNEHVSTVKEADILVKAAELADVTVTLESDTITVGSDVYTVLAEPVNLGGVLEFQCELQVELRTELRGRDR